MSGAALRGIGRSAILAGMSVTLAGCFGTPSLNLGDFSSIGEQAKPPTVERLVDHIDCELWTAYEKSQNNTTDSARKLLWNHLYDNQFVVAIDLTVTLTHNESANPSVTLTNPTDYRGGPIHVYRPAAPAPGTNATQPSSSYSRSIALAGQISGVQDRNFDFTYSRDLKDLFDDMKKNGGDDFCEAVKMKGLPLENDLKLEETINSGLLGIDQSNKSIENRYRPTRGIHEVVVTGSRPSSTTGAKSSSDTQFSSKIDFSLTLGGGVSPAVNTLWFKLGNGSSGGGGGGASGGSGGGGAGAGGGGGGGGQQMFNISRTSLDTLTLTFSANCKQENAPVLAIFRQQPFARINNNVTPPLNFAMGWKAKNQYQFATLSIPPFSVEKSHPVQPLNGLVTGGKDFGLLKGFAYYDGQTIHIDGVVKSPESEAEGPNTSSTSSGSEVTFKADLNVGPDGSLTIADIMGRGADGAPTVIGKMATLSLGIDELLGVSDSRSKDYWDSLPACTPSRSRSLATSGQFQNLLLKLPEAIRLAQ